MRKDQGSSGIDFESFIFFSSIRQKLDEVNIRSLDAQVQSVAK